ncbi:hypothetical protein DPMN_181782 [Dreissena polymorpha]|uniref:Uncharacterized protein n=1 Tax=Dreissena polymorpha TaxID=45954 RepID=A0A9D4I5L8_DREPO|nr:hypothetical protein DPMN_181782 [Dreissena polymorpha]
MLEHLQRGRGEYKYREYLDPLMYAGTPSERQRSVHRQQVPRPPHVCWNTLTEAEVST